MGFVDKLRMRNLYPSTGIGPPDLNGGFDIRKLMSMAQEPGPIAPIPTNYIPRPPIQMTPGQTFQEAKTTGLNYLPPTYLETPDQIHEKKKELLGIQNEGRNQLGYAKLEQQSDLGNRRLDIQQQRADVYDFKAKNPNMVFKVEEDGSVTGINPQTGETIRTAVDTFSPKEKQELVGSQKLEQIGAQGTNQINLQKLKGNQSLEQIGKRIQGQKDIQLSKPTTQLLPTQQKVQVQNRANELINTKPELSQFITIDPGGIVTVIPPSNGIFGPSGPSLEQYTEIQNALYPKSTSNTTISNKPEITTPTNTPSVPAGRVIIQKDGKQFHVPESQLQDALKQGYTKVGG